MPDIGDLLTDAARGGRGPDLEWVERRATSLRRRQLAVRSAAVAAVVVVLPWAMRLPSGHDELQQIPATRPTASAAAQPQPVAGEARMPVPAPQAVGPSRSSAQPSQGSGAGPRANARAPQGGRTGSPTTSPAPSTYPPAPSCHVSTEKLLKAGQSDSCGFTATRAGGWRVAEDSGAYTSDPDAAIVEVRRGSRITRYQASGGSTQMCASMVIRPGDVVVVRVRQTERGYRLIELGAGDGYGC